MPLLGVLGASWGILGACSRPLGASWGRRGGLGEILGVILGWGPRHVRSGALSGPPLGAVLGASWAVLGASGPLLGRSWAVLGRSWAPPGPSGGDLGGLLGRLGHWEAGKHEKAKIIKNVGKINDFCILGTFWGCSWRALGPSCGPRRPSRGHLRRRGAIFGRLEALLARPRRLLGPSWPALVPLGCEKAMRGNPGKGE